MDIKPFFIGKQISDLVDRPVSVAAADDPIFSDQVVYACYKVLPHSNTVVVKLDLELLGTLSGTMIGVPAATFTAQIRAGHLDANLTDAGREIMNVLSPVVVDEGRAIFQGIFPSPSAYSREAEQLLQSRILYKASFKATMAGRQLGFMTFISDI